MRIAIFLLLCLVSLPIIYAVNYVTLPELRGLDRVLSTNQSGSNMTFDVLTANQIGVGITSPNYMLDVAGNINASNIVVLGDVNASQLYGTLPWSNISGHPSACPADTWVSSINVTNICTGLPTYVITTSTLDNGTVIRNHNTSWITANQLVTGNTTQEIIDSINMSRVTVNCSNMMFADGSIGASSICDGDDSVGGAATGDKWIDSGTYIEPNSTFAVNVLVPGYIYAHDWSNTSSYMENFYYNKSKVNEIIGGLSNISSSNLQTNISAANTSMKGYVDGRITQENTSMKAFVISTNTSMKTYVDSVAGNTPLASDWNAANTSVWYALNGFGTANFSSLYLAIMDRWQLINFTTALTASGVQSSIVNNITTHAATKHGNTTAEIQSAEAPIIAGMNNISLSQMQSNISAANTSMKNYVDTNTITPIALNNGTIIRTGKNANLTELNVSGATIFTNGNVGIGKSSPNMLLDVAGQVNATKVTSNNNMETNGNFSLSDGTNTYILFIQSGDFIISKK